MQKCVKNKKIEQKTHSPIACVEKYYYLCSIKCSFLLTLKNVFL